MPDNVTPIRQEPVTEFLECECGSTDWLVNAQLQRDDHRDPWAIKSFAIANAEGRSMVACADCGELVRIDL